MLAYLVTIITYSNHGQFNKDEQGISCSPLLLVFLSKLRRARGRDQGANINRLKVYNDQDDVELAEEFEKQAKNIEQGRSFDTKILEKGTKRLGPTTKVLPSSAPESNKEEMK